MICTVIVAAGNSTRMGLGDKNMMDVAGKPVLRRTLEAFNRLGEVGQIIVVTAQDRVDEYRRRIASWNLPLPVTVVPGGDTRGQSVACGLNALPQECSVVLIQDGARPFVNATIIDRCIQSVRQHGSGVAAVKARDTIKRAQDNRVVETPDRSQLWMIQTPQAFAFPLIHEAYRKASELQLELTDDAAVLEYFGGVVHLVEGSYDNIKLTTPEDLNHARAILEQQQGGPMAYRIGEGYDVHCLMEGRKLILGGVDVPHAKGLLGHSDADVLVHAVMDALLGAAGLGDIGRHFPDSSEEFRGISSLELLRRVDKLLKDGGWQVENIDATVVVQRPKIAGYISEMQVNIAEVLGVEVSAVNVKATTTERLGFEGREEGISARAVALLRK